MTAALTVLAAYLAYVATPRAVRAKVGWYFWALAFGGALLFSAYSLLKHGTLQEPATGQAAAPTRLSALR